MVGCFACFGGDASLDSPRIRKLEGHPSGTPKVAPEVIVPGEKKIDR